MTHLSDFADLRKEPKKGIPANCKGGEWFGYVCAVFPIPHRESVAKARSHCLRDIGTSAPTALSSMRAKAGITKGFSMFLGHCFTPSSESELHVTHVCLKLLSLEKLVFLV